MPNITPGITSLQIHEYTVIDGELCSLREGSSVYIRRASGLVFYKTDPATTHSQHKREYVSRGREGGREGGELCVHQEG